MRRVSSSERPLTISLSAPARITMAVSGDPVVAIVVRNPSAIDSTATKTATTPAMPTTATSDEVSRWRMRAEIQQRHDHDLREPAGKDAHA